MSNIVKTKLSDGPQKAIFEFYIENDGIETELQNYVLVDPLVDFDTPVDQMTLLQVWYSFSWFDGLLSFDDLVDTPSWMLTRDAGGYFDFRYFGGIKDRSGIDHTGKLFLTTNGFSPLGSIGTLIVEIKKN